MVGTNLKEDGKYGSNTKDALMAFQKNYNLPQQEGKLDKSTLIHLQTAVMGYKTDTVDEYMNHKNAQSQQMEEESNEIYEGTNSKVWLIHGTFANRDTWTPEFREDISDTLDAQYTLVDWSGENNNKARVKAAENLADEIGKWHKSNKDEPVRLVGHSHGGNVAILATNLLESEHNIKVDTLITIATPVREYQLESSVGQHINVYNDYDLVQSNGGEWNKLKAGRTFEGAQNIEVILPKDRRQFKHRISNHSIMHSNKETWEKYIYPLIK